MTCAICPRACAVDRAEGGRGFCGESDDVRIAAACLHFGEEPLVTARGGSGAIFFTGCALRCAFCQNYQISQQGMGRAVSSDEFSAICMELQKAGAENINLITASHCVPRLSEYLRAARSRGLSIPCCWNSSAYENVETLSLLKDLVSIWLPDLKTLSTALARKLFLAQDYPAAAAKAIEWMIQNFPLEIETKISGGEKIEKIARGVIVRHLFLPGAFEETARVLEWLKARADGKAIVSLMSQYAPVNFVEGKKESARRAKALSAIENRLVSREEDADLRDLIDAHGFEYLFYQDLSCDTSWLPDFNNARPFPNAFAKPIWHWREGFIPLER